MVVLPIKNLRGQYRLGSGLYCADTSDGSTTEDARASPKLLQGKQQEEAGRFDGEK